LAAPDRCLPSWAGCAHINICRKASRVEQYGQQGALCAEMRQDDENECGKAGAVAATTACASATRHTAAGHACLVAEQGANERVEGLRALGNAAMARRDYACAVRTYKQAIMLEPERWVLWSNRSAAHMAMGNALYALCDAEQVYALEPESDKALVRMGAAYMGLDWHDAAQMAFTCYRRLLCRRMPAEDIPRYLFGRTNGSAGADEHVDRRARVAVEHPDPECRDLLRKLFAAIVKHRRTFESRIAHEQRQCAGRNRASHGVPHASADGTDAQGPERDDEAFWQRFVRCGNAPTPAKGSSHYESAKALDAAHAEARFATVRLPPRRYASLRASADARRFFDALCERVGGGVRIDDVAADARAPCPPGAAADADASADRPSPAAMGRGMFATRAYVAGQLILEEEPFLAIDLSATPPPPSRKAEAEAHAPSSSSSSWAASCVRCFRGPVARPMGDAAQRSWRMATETCARCGWTMCDPCAARCARHPQAACEWLGVHDALCPYAATIEHDIYHRVRTVALSSHAKHLPMLVRLMGMALARAAVQRPHGADPRVDVLDIPEMAHLAYPATVHREAAQVQCMTACLRAALGLPERSWMDAEWYVLASTILTTNGFTMDVRPNDPHVQTLGSGMAVYSLASILNHSCAPNAFWKFGDVHRRGNAIRVYALRDIRPGEQIFISYVDPDDRAFANPDARRRYLAAAYQFDCWCDRCVLETPVAGASQ